MAWKNLADAGFPDRILWHKAVAAKYPWYDITRVGVYGGSAGGQNALGGLLFHAAAGPRLHGRSTDGGEAHHMEHGREAVDVLLEQRLDRLRGHVSLGKAGAAGGDDRVDLRILDPFLDLLADLFLVIEHDRLRRQLMPGLLDYRGKQCARRIGRLVARVRDGEHGDVQRNEGNAFVDAGHGVRGQKSEIRNQRSEISIFSFLISDL